jgi:hypothetical protein
MRRSLRVTVMAASAAALLAAAPAAGAKSTGACPSGGDWTLASVADLGITPEEADGIPSLDGNGDGMTCTKPFSHGPLDGGFAFRDNTVQGG